MKRNVEVFLREQYFDIFWPQLMKMSSLDF